MFAVPGPVTTDQCARVPGRRCLCCQCPHCPVVPDTVRGVDRRKYLLGTMVGIILGVPSWQPASHQPEIEQKLIWPLSNHRHCHLTNCQQRVILSFLFVEGHFWCSELWESDYLKGCKGSIYPRKSPESQIQVTFTAQGYYTFKQFNKPKILTHC